MSLATTQTSLLAQEVYLTERIEKYVSCSPSSSRDGLKLELTGKGTPPPPPSLCLTSTKRDRMAHLNCVMFLSPDAETLEWVKEELAKPKYGGYWLCASCLSSLRSRTKCCQLIATSSSRFLKRVD